MTGSSRNRDECHEMSVIPMTLESGKMSGKVKASLVKWEEQKSRIACSRVCQLLVRMNWREDKSRSPIDRMSHSERDDRCDSSGVNLSRFSLPSMCSLLCYPIIAGHPFMVYCNATSGTSAFDKWLFPLASPRPSRRAYSVISAQGARLQRQYPPSSAVKVEADVIRVERRTQVHRHHVHTSSPLHSLSLQT